MKLAHFLWLLPFTCFLGGYLVMAFIMDSPTIETPQCIGKNIQQGLRILRDCDLNAKLLEEKEDNDLAEGTIIAQQPSYKQKIKPQQTVFLIVSKKSKKVITPSLIGKSLSHIASELKNNNIMHKNYPVASAYPHNTCIAQIPSAGKPLEDKKIITYSASQELQPVIVPNFTRYTAEEAIALLQRHGITPHLSHAKQPEKHHVCKTCSVVDQKPLAGSLIYLDLPIDIHLSINHQ